MTTKQPPIATAVITLTSLLLFAVPYWNDALRFDVDAPSLTGVILGHGVHQTAGHAFWSIGAFAVLGAVCEWRNRTSFAVTTALSALLIPIALALFPGNFTTYSGLSGIDSALFGLLCIHLAREGWNQSDKKTALAALALLAGFGGKVAYESVTGNALFADMGGDTAPVPLAHLVGLAVGVVVGCAQNQTSAFRKQYTTVWGTVR